MPLAFMTAITALYQPIWACVCIYVLIIARVFYFFGYTRFGPKGSICGAIFTMLPCLALLVGGFYSLFSWDASITRTIPFSY